MLLYCGQNERADQIQRLSGWYGRRKKRKEGKRNNGKGKIEKRREKDQFIAVLLKKVNVFKVPPAELEALLVSHPDISDAAVIGIPDDEAGQLPRAYVVTNGNVSENDILTFVEENVAPYKKLRGGLEFINEIPRSLSGKILRREVRDLYRKKGEKAKETNSIRRHTIAKKHHDAVVPVKNSSCCTVL